MATPKELKLRLFRIINQAADPYKTYQNIVDALSDELLNPEANRNFNGNVKTFEMAVARDPEVQEYVCRGLVTVWQQFDPDLSELELQIARREKPQ
jgi:uncharacterized protein YjaG (DUF416 family)